MQRERGPLLGKRTFLDFSNLSVYLSSRSCNFFPEEKFATFSDFIYTVLETRQLNYPGKIFDFNVTLFYILPSINKGSILNPLRVSQHQRLCQ